MHCTVVAPTWLVSGCAAHPYTIPRFTPLSAQVSIRASSESAPALPSTTTTITLPLHCAVFWTKALSFHATRHNIQYAHPLSPARLACYFIPPFHISFVLYPNITKRQDSADAALDSSFLSQRESMSVCTNLSSSGGGQQKEKEIKR